MTKDILAKLADELALPIESERQVVYIMVELRKLLETTGDKKTFPALHFHSNWVAHPALDRDLAEDIVMAINKKAKMFHQMSQMKMGQSIPIDGSLWQFLAPVVTLSNFRNELNAYLCKVGLDNSIPNDDRNWATFLRYYGEVIRDCPLRCVGQKLKFVDEVLIEVDGVQPEATAKFGWTLRLRWKWVNKVTGEPYFDQQFF